MIQLLREQGAQQQQQGFDNTGTYVDSTGNLIRVPLPNEIAPETDFDKVKRTGNQDAKFLQRYMSSLFQIRRSPNKKSTNLNTSIMPWAVLT